MRFQDLTRHARAHCYVNVGHGNVGTVVIYNAIRDTSTSDYPQESLYSAVSECSCKSSDRSGGRLLPPVQKLQLDMGQNQSH
ncbi:hypothetical protein L211DRAFT_842408 [Terfezia boudieri ATCC MYA-4762]|uniref:Uncharacterized protein n=1 Tax=Terfezia boudieri ATCC MYA-4762 TaxID=1051890 RepID=A0A3N4LA11_9PEZI|nr:hypothetical protein L211DRAFT_842408 [Terfezia boudieri ATCC MYA-4762]